MQIGKSTLFARAVRRLLSRIAVVREATSFTRDAVSSRRVDRRSSFPKRWEARWRRDRNLEWLFEAGEKRSNFPGWSGGQHRRRSIHRPIVSLKREAPRREKRANHRSQSRVRALRIIMSQVLSQGSVHSSRSRDVSHRTCARAAVDRLSRSKVLRIEPSVPEVAASLSRLPPPLISRDFPSRTEKQSGRSKGVGTTETVSCASSSR